jgi:hypothetical protein
MEGLLSIRLFCPFSAFTTGREPNAAHGLLTPPKKRGHSQPVSATFGAIKRQEYKVHWQVEIWEIPYPTDIKYRVSREKSNLKYNRPLNP